MTDACAWAFCRVGKAVEDDLEEISGVVSEEMYLHHWDAGTYDCARCGRPLYHSRDKWMGPCPWPSWRKGINSWLVASCVFKRLSGDGGRAPLQSATQFHTQINRWYTTPDVHTVRAGVPRRDPRWHSALAFGGAASVAPCNLSI
jgi:ribosomal protein L37E